MTTLCWCRKHSVSADDATYVRNGVPLCTRACVDAHDAAAIAAMPPRSDPLPARVRIASGMTNGGAHAQAL